MVLVLWNLQREFKEQAKKEKPQISVFKGVFTNKCKNCLLAKMAGGPASNLNGYNALALPFSCVQKLCVKCRTNTTK
jgi:hypothetical protein